MKWNKMMMKLKQKAEKKKPMQTTTAAAATDRPTKRTTDEVEITASTVLVSQVKLTKNIINIEERHKDVN